MPENGLPGACGVARLNRTQQAGRAHSEPTYNGHICLYRLSSLSGRAQQLFGRAYARYAKASAV